MTDAESVSFIGHEAGTLKRRGVSWRHAVLFLCSLLRRRHLPLRLEAIEQATVVQSFELEKKGGHCL